LSGLALTFIFYLCFGVKNMFFKKLKFIFSFKAKYKKNLNRVLKINYLNFNNGR